MKISAYLHQHARRIALSLAVMALLVLNVVGVLELTFLQRLENYSYDLRLLWTMPGGTDKRIVIIDLDEKSLQEQGQWPWPRNKLAQLMDQLFDHYKIDALGSDVVFAERDDSSGLGSLEMLGREDLRSNAGYSSALAKLRPKLMYDQIFADSLKNRRVALGYYFRHGPQLNAQSSQVGQLPPPVLPRGTFDPAKVGAVVASGFSANLPELQQAAAAGGFFNASPLVDADGVFRRISLLQMYDSALYETLSLAVARLALREPTLQLTYEDAQTDAVALESLRLGARRIPVDADIAALVPFRGRQGSFTYVSASDVLQGKVSPDVLRGAIALLGATAPGLLDLRNTPMQENYAGVEMHANMIAAILDGTINERPAYTLGMELLLLLLLGTLLALGLPALSPVGATSLSAVAAAGMVLVNLYFWKVGHLVLPLASGMVLILALFVLNMSYGYYVDSRSKRHLARLFGQYVPTELVDEMAKDPEAYSLEGSNREMTVLFSDVRGFTTISEGLTPQQITELMNEFLTPMTRIIQRHRGTIDKYMGDAIMAFWGAPLADPLHARNALLAGMDMIAELKALEPRFKARGWPTLHIGVGLNTGDMTVGNMGSEFRLAYTVMGDAVNLGSRLESLTKEYGVSIMASEFTRAAVPDFAWRELDRVRVKGKDKPVTIYEPLGLLAQLPDVDKAELIEHAQALEAYRAQNWALAAAAFGALQREYPQRGLYRIFSARVQHLAEHPPGTNWDGAHNFVTK